MTTILIHPLLTEKMTELGTKRQYAFKVSTQTNKIEVAKAVEKKFNVEVVSVRTMQIKGKRKFSMTKRGRMEGKKSNWKKAIVTLKDGQSIDFLANV
ncbi:MAG: 50S ribosomal protein L23 [Bacteroidetes bacterium]|nr:50S ribosomal protein L23 [Bacteroidota bacterium]